MTLPFRLDDAYLHNAITVQKYMREGSHTKEPKGEDKFHDRYALLALLFVITVLEVLEG